jgi:L-lactate dehydrogenase
LSKEEKERIAREVREQAYKIIDGKGATFFGIGAATSYLLEVILKNKKEILPLSVYLRGEYGFSDIALGVPARVGKKGIIKIIEKKLNPEEERKMKESASNLKKML